MEKKLYRLPEKGKIAGVAAGLAEYLAVDTTLMRLLFVAALLMTGGGALVVYIVLAIFLPTPGEVKSKHLDVGDKVETLAHEMTKSGRAQRAGNYVGIGFVLLGIWLLIGQLFPGWFDLQWNVVWPIAVILLGIWMIARGKK